MSDAAAALGSGRSRKRGAWIESRWFGVVAPIGIVVLLIALWQLSTLFLNKVVVSSPAKVVDAFGFLVSSGTLGASLAISVKELYIGLALGLVLGTVLGMAIGRYPLVDAILGPFINAMNATPLVVAIPLVVIWLGVNGKARLLFITLITLWPVLLNTAAGMRNVKRNYMEVGTAFGLGERALMRKIAIPATIPYVLAGARIGLGLAIIGLIVAEMEVSTVGVGYLLTLYGNGFQTARLLALVILVALFGVVNVLALRILEYRFFRWVSVVGG